MGEICESMEKMKSKSKSSADNVMVTIKKELVPASSRSVQVTSMSTDAGSETAVVNPLFAPKVAAAAAQTSLPCVEMTEASPPPTKKQRTSYARPSSEGLGGAATTTTTTTTTQAAPPPLSRTPNPAPAFETEASTTSDHHPAVAASAVAASPTKTSPSAVVSPTHEVKVKQQRPHHHHHHHHEETPAIATKYVHLQAKYCEELQYMLSEFEKLERQLLGARKTEENAGSRERREKLHSFILHLRDTIKQVETGVEQEVAPESASSASAAATVEDGTNSNNKHEDTVKRLEEHILANLLPVKVRLKKQLAAQQGARHNPVGMPHRGFTRSASTEVPKRMFVATPTSEVQTETTLSTSGSGGATKLETTEYIAPKEPAKPVDEKDTQLGKPIATRSSLTKKLHGGTLAASTTEGEGNEKDKKTYYGGMALGSNQMESSVAAASTVHKLMVRETGAMIEKNRKAVEPVNDATKPLDEPRTPAPVTSSVSDQVPKAPPVTVPVASVSSVPEPPKEPQISKPVTDDLERRKLRKKRKKRLKADKGDGGAKGHSGAARERKGRQAKKSRGPRQVEYMCALCNEVYKSTCDYNPWWALAQHECPKCKKTQIPRVDIGAAANAIEYHPALLAHADDNCGTPLPPPPVEPEIDSSALGSDAEGSDISTDGEDSVELGSDEEESEILTPADQAENEDFGFSYDGPKLHSHDAGRLLILMAHASTCPCLHKCEKQRETCRSAKWLMLHVRDCPGTTANDDICPFPWCRKVKHLLYHLVSCTEKEKCRICSRPDVNRNMGMLMGLNNHRFDRMRCRVVSEKKTPSAGPETRLNSHVRVKTEENLVGPEIGQGAAPRADEPRSSVLNLKFESVEDELASQAAQYAAEALQMKPEHEPNDLLMPDVTPAVEPELKTVYSEVDKEILPLVELGAPETEIDNASETADAFLKEHLGSDAHLSSLGEVGKSEMELDVAFASGDIDVDPDLVAGTAPDLAHDFDKINQPVSRKTESCVVSDSTLPGEQVEDMADSTAVEAGSTIKVKQEPLLAEDAL